jgi:hypothetical protein
MYIKLRTLTFANEASTPSLGAYDSRDAIGVTAPQAEVPNRSDAAIPTAANLRMNKFPPDAGFALSV